MNKKLLLKVQGYFFVLLLISTILLEVKFSYLVKHSFILISLNTICVIRNKYTWKAGVFLSLWGIVNFFTNELDAAEPTMFQIGHWLFNSTFSIKLLGDERGIFFFFSLWCYIIFFLILLIVKNIYDDENN